MSLLNKMSVAMLGVESLDRSVPFYRDKLGLTLQNQFEGFAFFDAGSATLALSTALGTVATPKAGATEFVFTVDNASAARSQLAERGCLFINELREIVPGSWASTLTDPDGHRITVFGPK